jgi:diguanylate cyclase
VRHIAVGHWDLDRKAQSMKWLSGWWRRPDHFDWLTGYLQARGLSVNTRRALAAVAASLVLVPANVVWGPTPFCPRLALAVAALAGLAGLVMAALWLSRWPTRGQSLFFAMTGSVTIAAGCLWQTRPIIALMACSALAVQGGYIAFFHAARHMLLNLALAAAIGAIEAARMAATDGRMLAITGYFLVIELNVAVPWAIHVVVRALGVDLLRANRDPLTGLLNRRACEQAIVGRILASPGSGFLAIAMVDLDRFKALNDSRGHAAGDVALVAVAGALSAACNDTGLIGRVGGEEFLIADIVTTECPPGWGQQFCAAVAAVRPPVTASVGTATLDMRHIGCSDVERAFRQLAAHADAAMYEAKRRGGNQARHHRASPHGAAPVTGNDRLPATTSITAAKVSWVNPRSDVPIAGIAGPGS